jgi:predicted helicase
MRNFLQKNIGLCIGRASQVVGIEKPWNIVFISENITDMNIFYRGGELLFPLYLYPEKVKSKKHSGSIMMVFEPKAEYETKQPNINQALIEQLTNEFKKTPTPEQIFYYIYAVLYSNTYRTKYAEFLKIDFPRIPFTCDYKLFIKMGEYGQRLADLHLLNSKETDSQNIDFNGKGKNDVEKVKYEKGRVYINKEQYFDGIKPDIWEYQIGGYQVCDKWLKDRKGMILSHDDIKYYSKIVTALQKTIEIQKKIDAIYSSVEKEIFSLK